MTLTATAPRIPSPQAAQLPAHRLALRRRRFGVAALESEASATNQAFGMSAGRPTGMPANFGVSVVRIWLSRATSQRAISSYWTPDATLTGAVGRVVLNSPATHNALDFAALIRAAELLEGMGFMV